MKTVTVTISGEQGIGKSTLARILMSRLEGHVVVESAEEIPFGAMDYEELEQWTQRLFADVKVVFKTEQRHVQTPEDFCMDCARIDRTCSKHP